MNPFQLKDRCQGPNATTTTTTAANPNNNNTSGGVLPGSGGASLTGYPTGGNGETSVGASSSTAANLPAPSTMAKTDSPSKAHTTALTRERGGEGSGSVLSSPPVSEAVPPRSRKGEVRKGSKRDRRRRGYTSVGEDKTGVEEISSEPSPVASQGTRGAAIHRPSKKKPSIYSSQPVETPRRAYDSTASLTKLQEVSSNESSNVTKEDEEAPSLGNTLNHVITESLHSMHGTDNTNSGTNGNNNNNNNNNNGNSTNDCVGVAPLTLMHLLGGLGNTSDKHEGGTTVSVDNITFLVFPLPLHAETTAKTSPEHVNHNVATFVIAMSSPDVEEGNISRFFQCFVNILLREELRMNYVTAQLQLLSSLWTQYEINEQENREDYDAASRGAKERVSHSPGTTLPGHDRPSRLPGVSSDTLPTQWDPTEDCRDEDEEKERSDSRERDEEGEEEHGKPESENGGEANRSMPQGSLSSETAEHRNLASEGRRKVSNASESRRNISDPKANETEGGGEFVRLLPPARSKDTRRQKTVYDYLVQKATKKKNFTLGKELIEIVNAIHIWNVNFRSLPRRRVLQELQLMVANPQSRSFTGKDGRGEERYGQYTLPRGITVNKLLFLPLSHLTGVQLPESKSCVTETEKKENSGPASTNALLYGDTKRQDQLFSLFARLHPCGLIYLAKDLRKPETWEPQGSTSDEESARDSREYVEYLEREYEQTLGRQYARLLPLKKVITECLVNLKVPWRVGAFYKSLELSLLEAVQRGNEKHPTVSYPASEEPLNLQTTGLSFIVLEVLEFLRAREVLVVDDGVSLWFTHSTILSPTVVDPKRVPKPTKDRTEPLPQTVLLYMLWRMQSEMKHTSNNQGYNQSMNYFYNSVSVFSHNTARHPVLHLLSPVSGTVDGHTPTDAASEKQKLRSLLKLKVHCAWGSACPFCESLAFHPSYWYVTEHRDDTKGVGDSNHQLASSVDSAVLLTFPSLDRSVTACAAHFIHAHYKLRLKAASGSVESRDLGDVRGETENVEGEEGKTNVTMASPGMTRAPAPFLRPWFVKPYMYLVPSDVHCLSAHKTYQSLLTQGGPFSFKSGDKEDTTTNVANHASKIPSSFFSTIALDEATDFAELRKPSHHQPERLPAGSTTRSPLTTHHNSRLFHFISNDDEEGNIVLLKDLIGEELKHYLSQMEEFIRTRLEQGYERQVEVEQKASKQFVLQPRHSPTGKPASPTPDSTLLLSTSTVHTEGKKTDPPASSTTDDGSTLAGIKPMRYTKRVLQDRSALQARSVSPFAVAPPHSTTTNSSSLLTVSPLSHPFSSNYEQSYDTRGELLPRKDGGGAETRSPSAPFPPLQLVQRTLPLRVLLQVTLHHVIAILWGRVGIDLDVLTRQLERNLRRLRPFLREMTYAQEMVEKGCNSKSLMASRRALLQQQKKKSYRRLSESEMLRRGKKDMWSFPPEGEGESTLPTVQQVQLLQTYELYESLSLLECLRPYQGVGVEVIPTALLLHTIVNEFSDVLLTCGSSESTTEKFRLDAAAL